MIMCNDILDKPRLLVIGNGMAGARVVEEILKRDRSRFQITMIGSEPYGNYNRILLSNVLNGSQDAKEIFINTLEWYDQHDLELIAGVAATEIDRERRAVYLADGRGIPFDKLII